MEECILWDGPISSGGYGRKYDPDVGRYVLAHRWVVAQIVGWDATHGLVVRHRCDNPPCVNPMHLQLGTHSDNMRDRSKRKPRSYARKLTDQQVAEIRASTDRQVDLAERYCVTQGYISHLKRGHARQTDR